MSHCKLFVPVLHSDMTKPIKLRMEESDVKKVQRLYILGVYDQQEPRMFFVERADMLIEYLGCGVVDITFTNLTTCELSKRPNPILIAALIGTQNNTTFEQGSYHLREFITTVHSEPTCFSVRRIDWQETSNPEVLRYIFGSFPTALLEAELERRKLENEQDEEQDAHELEVREQEQDEYDEHQRRELDRKRGRHK